MNSTHLNKVLLVISSIALSLLISSINVGAQTVALNFASVDTSAGAVDPTAYLASYGITLSGTAYIYTGLLPGINFITGTSDSSGACLYTLTFSEPLSSFSLVRCGWGQPGSSGYTRGEWTATAFDGQTSIGSVGEGFVATYSAGAPQTFTLNGPDITSVQISGTTENRYGGEGAFDELVLVPVPEPASLSLLAFGMFGITCLLRRRR